MRTSVGVILGAADGYFVFDLCHVREYGYWDALRQGIDAAAKKQENENYGQERVYQAVGRALPP